MLNLAVQARNQDFLRAGEFSWNYDTLINIHLQQEKNKPRREKISNFFCLKTLKNFNLNEKS